MEAGLRLRTHAAGKAKGGLRVQSSEVRPWVGVRGWGLGPARPEGTLKGGGSGSGPQQAPRCPSGLVKRWPSSLLILQSPEGLSPSPLIPSLWVGPSRAWEPLPSPSCPSGAPVLSGLYFASPPQLPQDPRGQRGPWRAEDQARDLSRLPKAQEGRGNAGRVPF